MKISRLLNDVQDNRSDLPSRGDGPIVIAPEMVRLYGKAALIAPARISVLIAGETGVGKEHLAEMIHTLSNRSHHPFIRINCAAIAPSLFETELFGHERGSFTGADRTKVGWLEAAGAGTVFLDEIGEMPVNLQSKLLRALETGGAARVGGTDLRPIAARFVAASNRDLEVEIERGTFRRDVYHRIAGVRLRVPPLRERTVEIWPLANAFVRTASAELSRPAPVFSFEARAALMTYSWPGNIRELRNTIEAATLLASEGVIQLEDLQLPSQPGMDVGDFTPLPLMQEAGHRLTGAGPTPLRDRRYPTREEILAALANCGGNQTLAATRLGIGRRTLCRVLVRLGIPRPRRSGLSADERPPSISRSELDPRFRQ